jgi:putative proteasome-type protease
MLVYQADELEFTKQRRFSADDPDLNKIRVRWEQALRQGIARLPNIRLRPKAAVATPGEKDKAIELVESAGAQVEPSDTTPELQPQMGSDPKKR